MTKSEDRSSPASDGSGKASSKRARKHHADEANGAAGHTKKPKRRKGASRAAGSGTPNGGVSHRRLSMTKAARDPRDEPPPPSPAGKIDESRSPSPAIDFDGLSRLSTSNDGFRQELCVSVSPFSRS